MKYGVGVVHTLNLQRKQAQSSDTKITQTYKCCMLLELLQMNIRGQVCVLRNKTIHYMYTSLNTLRTGDADLRFYITTVQDG